MFLQAQAGSLRKKSSAHGSVVQGGFLAVTFGCGHRRAAVISGDPGAVIDLAPSFAGTVALEGSANKHLQEREPE